MTSRSSESWRFVLRRTAPKPSIIYLLSQPLADAAAEEEPAVLSVSMTKSDGGFGLGFIMEDIVLVNRVDPGGQAQVRP